MTHARIRRRRSALLLLGASVLLAVAGCAGGAAPASVTSSSSSTDTPAAVVAYPMPDLGPSPAPAALDPAERERLRLEQQDQQWEGVTATYPEATRPGDPFVEYRDSVAPDELVDCFEAAGMPVDIGTTADSTEPAGLLVSPADEAQAISAFACWSAYPSNPVAPMTTEQIDYLYSYLTEYLVPCYEANGVSVPEAPIRADFVAQWPDQGWFPSTSDAMLTPEEDQAIRETCVSPA